MAASQSAGSRLDELWRGDSVGAVLGMERVAVEPGRAVLSMTVRPDMLNSLDMCHGGVIFTLADAAFAYASNSHGQAAVGQNGSILFLVAGRLEDVLTAEAREVRRAGRTGLYDVTVTRQDGVAVAEFRGLSRLTGARDA